MAALTVEDSTGKATRIEVYPAARSIEYPRTPPAEAIRLASASPKVRAELERRGSYAAAADYDPAGDEWTVSFYSGPDREEEIARVGISDAGGRLEYAWTGEQIAWQMARGEEGAYGKEANHPLVWGALALLFALAFARTDRVLSLRNLDVLALLGFLISHHFFRAGEPFWAVALLYPPLVYLFARTLLAGFGVGERVERTSNLPAPALFALGALASGFIIALNIHSRVIDVGYAGAAGADRILSGTLPYGNMPEEISTGDTYGPLNYLIYVPANLLFGFSGEWDYLPAAHAVTVAAFVIAALALMAAGRRLAGAPGAAALFFAWAVFPHTVYATNNNTNDVLLAAFGALGLAAFASPVARGATVAAGFAIKLAPLVLAPLWLAQNGLRPGPVLKFLLGGLAVFAGSFWVLALDGSFLEGLRLFYERTFAYQTGRETPWSIYGQIPETRVLQRPAMALVAFVALLTFFLPRERTVRRLAALSAALLIGVQLTLNYWFYPYLVWFAPFAFVALLLATDRKTPLDGPSEPSGSPLRRVSGKAPGR
ncbi:hypothetical protein E0L93_05445 [Rubrobacter taiwanensis]|uniref:DUF2029 domain-containing protein n=1 Tax=Rubrobacter taiwanensis TaxID=185139 RepID=A0A4R1BM69_9ACTN|nr:hypothetical protein [Rubrobacter taiwanensis]TCJ18437.1 hypothetical protein E0L93_05445 [Rubrobacter taiwanensis]